MNELVTTSRAMQEVVSAALDVAATPATVFIRGEAGTGKTVLARSIHDHSARAHLPFSIVSCSMLNDDELAKALAHGGTAVLDEIGALTFDEQGRVLKALESAPASRIIAITSRDVATMTRETRFRADLYYRLDVFPIRMPSLRERADDLPRLSTLLLERIGQSLGQKPPAITERAIRRLETTQFPGNARELANVLERGLIRCHAAHLDVDDLGLNDAQLVQGATHYPTNFPLDLGEIENIAIAEALRRTNGNRTHAARLLGIGVRTLRQKLNGTGPRARAQREVELDVEHAVEAGASNDVALEEAA